MATSRELSFTTADGTMLVGTLLLPAGDGPHPAALLVPGSGPVDRDSDVKRMPLGVTRELAESLAASGIASFRFGKRGTGASQGSFLETTWDQARGDVRLALTVLREQSEVDAGRVLVIGHSEGSMHAAAVAADDPSLAGVALLSGPSGTGEATVRWQAAQIVPTLPAPVRFLLRVLRQDPVRSQDKLFARFRGSDETVMRVQGRRMNAGWYRGFLDHDTGADLARMQVPVLALTGAKDLQADPADVGRMRALVGSPFEGEVLDDLNHILRHTPDAASLSAYRKQIKQQPVDPRVTDRLVAWAKDRVGPPSDRFAHRPAVTA